MHKLCKNAVPNHELRIPTNMTDWACAQAGAQIQTASRSIMPPD
jgi:hypothetical protein